MKLALKKTRKRSERGERRREGRKKERKKDGELKEKRKVVVFVFLGCPPSRCLITMVARGDKSRSPLTARLRLNARIK